MTKYPTPTTIRTIIINKNKFWINLTIASPHRFMAIVKRMINVKTVPRISPHLFLDIQIKRGCII